MAYVRYSIEGFGPFQGGDKDGKMFVKEIFSSNIDAHNSLLNYIYVHADQIVTVEIPLRPSKQEYWHLTKRYNIAETKLLSRGIHMGRVVNVEDCITGIPARVEGKISIHVIDDFCEWNNGCYNLESN